MEHKHTKVAILGVGRVGAALAHQITAQRLCNELVLVDIDQRKAWAEATDLQHSLGFGRKPMIVRSGSYYDCSDADICVICVAAANNPTATRLERIDHAATMLGRIIPSVMATEFSGIFLVVTNPVDLMTWLVQQLSDLPPERVIGTGTTLDSARLRYYLADALDVEIDRVDAFCMGEHGESQMIPWSQVRIDGKPLIQALQNDPSMLPDFDKDAISNTIADITYQILDIKGMTNFATAAAAAEIIQAILDDTNRTMTVSAMLQGQYGAEDVYLGVPAVLGASGVQWVCVVPLTNEEREQLQKSIRTLQEYMVNIS